MKPIQKNEFKEAEALKEISPLPFEPEKTLPVEIEAEVADTPDEFRAAIGYAQMEGIGAIEVTERMFKYLVKNQKTKYLTYGDPGVKVFLKGTRKEIESEERMSAEAYGEMQAKKRAQGRA